MLKKPSIVFHDTMFVWLPPTSAAVSTSAADAAFLGVVRFTDAAADATCCSFQRRKMLTQPQPQTQPLTPIKTLFSTSLTRLYLSHIPSLVELPSSFQILDNLTDLRITHCKNLETLPVGINLKSLWRINFSGCSRLKNFPDISTNISVLGLFRTGIEEVPCWVDKFSKLENLFMPNSKKLKNVSLNVYKSKSLAKIDDDCAPLVKLCFVNCFNLEQEALLQQESIIKYIILPSVKVPSYFTHRTNGNSLTNIPLPEIQKPFFRFRACAVFEESLPPKSCLITIRVSCRFGGRLEEKHFDSEDQSCSFWTYQDGRHMVIFDCFFLLHEENSHHPAQLKYDHVDIRFHLTDDSSKFSLVGCGIRLPNDTTPSMDSRASNSNVVQDNNYETEESEDSDIETERNRKPLTACLARLTCA